MPRTYLSPRIVGIAGPSACGKTTFAHALQEALGAAQCVIISHDDYYRDLSHLSLDERAGHNFDDPSALETELLAEHLARLRSGQAITKPLYDFSRHTRQDRWVEVAPAPVVVVEGILVLAEAALRACLDTCIYLDTPPDICLARRVLRDVQERGRTVAFVIDQYLRTVRPMQQEWVWPSVQYADVVVTPSDFEAGVAEVARRLAPRAAHGGTSS